MQVVADWWAGVLFLTAFVLGWIAVGRVFWMVIADAPRFLPM